MGPKPIRPSTRGPQKQRVVRHSVPETQWTPEWVQEEVALSFGKSGSFSSVISLFPEFTKHESREFPPELLRVLAEADPDRARVIARNNNAKTTPTPFLPVHRISTFTTDDMASTELASGHALEDPVPAGTGGNPDPTPGAAGQGAPLEGPGNLLGDESNIATHESEHQLFNLLPSIPPATGAAGPGFSTGGATTAAPASALTPKELHLTDPTGFGLPLLQYCGRHQKCPKVDLERLSPEAKNILKGFMTQADDGTSLNGLVRYLSLRLIGGTVANWALPFLSVEDWKNFFTAVDTAVGSYHSIQS